MDGVENRERKNSTLFKVKIKLLDWTIERLEACNCANKPTIAGTRKEICVRDNQWENMYRKNFSRTFQNEIEYI